MDALGLDHHRPGARVQHKWFHKVVLGDVGEGWRGAGREHNLLGLFGACRRTDTHIQ